MKTNYVLHRFPDEWKVAGPFIAAEQGQRRIVLLDADVDGLQEISFDQMVQMVDKAVLNAIANLGARS